jgi:hypothetical protein
MGKKRNITTFSFKPALDPALTAAGGGGQCPAPFASPPDRTL